MSGTDEDDALLVLTAAMLTPAQFPSVLADDYPAACGLLGLEPLRDGYGLVFGQDGAGARWTVAITDTALVACAIAAWDCGLEYDLSPDERSVVVALPGWPLPVAVAAPGVPAPHDPTGEDAAGSPLAPPDTGSWGPAQRRLGADEIASQWWTWREQLDGESAGASADGAAGTGTRRAGDEAHQAEDEGASARTGSGEAVVPLSPGVRRALAEAEAYVRTPPPVGRVRSASGAVRADGPGWSLVARTDDMAFVLLDEEPGQVLPVRPGPSLPTLLKALDELAARPV